MNITILGSGTCVPSLKRSSCSVLVQIENTGLLFDSGAGTIRQLLKTGATINDISYIFYSHLHPDHTGEFASFLFSTKYPETYRRRSPFTIVGANGFRAFYEALKTAYGYWIELEPDLMQIRELHNEAPDHLDFDNFTVDSAPMSHSNQSLAYRVTDADGRSMVYSGDTDLCSELITLARETHLLICECAMPDELKVEGHLTPSLAGTIATKAQVKKLVLTHFYPECDAVDVAAQCRKTYAGPLVLAQDLAQLKIDSVEIS